jgi:adenine-specific DNA-methyltransferase
MSLKELKTQCKERGIKGYSNKSKDELIKLLSGGPVIAESSVRSTSGGPVVPSEVPAEKIYRLNYIGSKFQLLNWIEEQIKEKTGWASFKDKVVGDLFSGTGIVSYHFRKKGAITVSNDAELYSSIITHAFALSDYNDTCKSFIEKIQKELDEGKNKVGYITRNYSPYEECERMFFTVENAMKIDYISQRISDENFSENDYKFVLASLLLSADNVSNVPAVYGCYLKNFKAKATKPLKLEPIHTNKIKCKDGSIVYNKDVVTTSPENKKLNLTYLDPPYNERQYSKNYFPLNMIALSPEEQEKQPPLKGKTGIPENCFLSPFCKKGQVENAFDTIFSNINTEWLFMSYNSESIVSKERLIDIMKKYGEVSVIEKDYKRFKSFEYNEDTEIKEYLFCLKKN